MNGLFEAAHEAAVFMAARRWPFCLIGGLAVQRWGEPRTTLGADFTLLTGWGEEAPFVEALLDRFESRIPDGWAFALENRVLLIRTSNGTAVDIALGALPFEAEMVRRSVPIEFAPGIRIPCCTAEDLFIMKAFAGRSRYWLDAVNVAVRRNELDRVYILDQLAVLCDLKQDTETLERARKLLEAS